MATQPPPQRPQNLSIVVKGLRVVVPTAAVVAVAFILTPGLAYLVLPPAAPAQGPLPLPVPQVPLQGWTTDASMAALPLVLGALAWPSAPLEGQITTTSQCKWPNQMRRGACWIQVGGVKPPCKAPNGEAPLYEDDGACWAPVIKAARSPSSGEPRTAPVAGPED